MYVVSHTESATSMHVACDTTGVTSHKPYSIASPPAIVAINSSPDKPYIGNYVCMYSHATVTCQEI
jgi:hypothetical protein